MKKLYIFVYIISLWGLQAQAQVIGSAYLDANNVKAWFNSNGVNFWNLQADAKYYVPANSTQTSFYSQSLWLSGKDSMGNVSVAADRFGANGFDFTPGPISNNYDSLYDLTWKNIFVINRSTIDSFINWYANPTAYPGYQTPSEILNWPAHGDVSKGQAYYLAPFKDVNLDGMYVPSSGDYPLIKGDKALWYVYNDDRSNHPETGGPKIGAEVHVMAYAYNCSSVFDNTIFIDYTIFKRTAGDLTDFRIGVFADMDLGYSYDDYIGCDVKRGSFYTYNGKAIDGNGTPEAYGANPPAISLTVLKGPYLAPDGIDNPAFIIDSLGNPIPACDYSINGANFGDSIIDNERMGLVGFSSFTNSSSAVYGDPETASEYNYFLHNQWKNGTSLLYGGYGDSLSSYGPACRFMYPGLSDPCNWGLDGATPNGPKIWTEGTAGNLPGDRRGLGIVGPTILQGNTPQNNPLKLELVIVWARDTFASSLPALMDAIDTVRYYSQNNMHPCGGTFLALPKTYEKTTELQIDLFPNPAQNQTQILFNQDFSGQIEIFDISGKKIKMISLLHCNSYNLNLNSIHQGLYFLRISNGDFTKIKKLVKN
jgi:hypothetical protein